MRITPLTVCKYPLWFSRYFNLNFYTEKRHKSHILNGNEVRMTSQLQDGSQVELLSLYNLENHEYSCFKFSGIILFLTSKQNKQITLLLWQSKKQYSLSIYQRQQLLWLMWNQFGKCDNLSKIGTGSPKDLQHKNHEISKHVGRNGGIRQNLVYISVCYYIKNGLYSAQRNTVRLRHELRIWKKFFVH